MISIIIPTYQEEGFIEKTLAQFKALSLPHELIVTDGGSTDKTLEIVHRYTNKVVVWDRAAKGRRQTFGEAKNMGAASASGEYLVFIDADVVVPEPTKFFTTMFTLFEQTPTLVATTVPMRVLPEFKRGLDEWWGAPLNVWYRLENNVFGQGNASGEFQMFKAEAFRKVGGYAEKLAAGEDNDMFRRVRGVGLTRYVSTHPIYHTYRRAHKIGWFHLYGQWLKNGFSVAFRGKAAYKEWEVVR